MGKNGSIGSCLMFFYPCALMFASRPPTLMASIAVKSGMIMHTRVVFWAGIFAADKGKAALNVRLLYVAPPSLARILLFKSSYCRDSAGFWEIYSLWEFEWARGNTLYKQSHSVISVYVFPDVCWFMCAAACSGESHPSSNDTLSLNTKQNKPLLLYNHDQKQ